MYVSYNYVCSIITKITMKTYNYSMASAVDDDDQPVHLDAYIMTTALERDAGLHEGGNVLK